MKLDFTIPKGLDGVTSSVIVSEKDSKQKIVGKIADFFHLYNIAVETGIEGIVYRLVCREKYKKSKKFFKDNKELVDIICSKLDDDESKQVYMQAIKYRQGRQRKYRPKFTPNQYFVNDFIKFDKNTVFVDCGANNGDTFDDFKSFTLNEFAKYIAFEPGEQIEDFKLRNNDDRICFVKAGAWDKDDELWFKNADGGSVLLRDKSIVDKNIEKVLVKAIDNVKECFDATCIKMDIEGSEWNALKGAAKTIERNHPLLEICIYHSDEDMIRIPNLIMNFGGDTYKYYVRHHSHITCDTVFYAVPC